ncbi:GNAT family N-acetyltransferase [Ideonella sp.]|jgi:GNAT superfamily N-acetyltransferase|uniref:GNAT family N-acetyltransferase n=1 Tax=Ideonella sp. TaxID=1929293 RepID=UPI0037C126A7
MLVIKDVDPQGADAMALLHEASLDARALYPELFTDGSPSATNAPLGERSVYIVAYARGLPVACGAFRPLSESTAEVRRMYVHREHRRQGTARAVLAHLEQAALQLGYCRFVLETGCKQVPAMRLYEALGFRRIPAFGEYVHDPISVCYELALPAQR